MLLLLVGITREPVGTWMPAQPGGEGTHIRKGANTAVEAQGVVSPGQHPAAATRQVSEPTSWNPAKGPVRRAWRKPRHLLALVYPFIRCPFVFVRTWSKALQGHLGAAGTGTPTLLPSVLPAPYLASPTSESLAVSSRVSRMLPDLTSKLQQHA